MEITMPELTDSQKINLNVITLNTAVNDLQSDVRELNKVVLLGNGELPLRETVRNHEKFLGEFKYWVRFVLGLVIAQFIAFTTASVIAYVKFLPVLEQLASKR
jgi:hypothetical protein